VWLHFVIKLASTIFVSMMAWFSTYFLLSATGIKADRLNLFGQSYPPWPQWKPWWGWWLMHAFLASAGLLAGLLTWRAKRKVSDFETCDSAVGEEIVFPLPVAHSTAENDDDETNFENARMQQIPSKADWHSGPWCLDTECAYHNFFGKTLAEATALFEESSLRYQEDLVWMPTRCLIFYIHAYIDYLISDKSQNDSDGASCFFSFVEGRHEDIRTFPPETIERTKTVLQKLGANQSWYEADPEIYGDFAKKAKQMIELLGVV
jgi:hypothetical protein